MKKWKNKIYLGIVAVLMTGLPFYAKADPTFGDLATGYGCTESDAVDCVPNPIEANTLVELLTAVLSLLAKLMVPIIVIVIVYSGFLFFTAQGDTGKITSAKKTLAWAIVGAIIIVSAWALYQLVAAILTSLSAAGE